MFTDNFIANFKQMTEERWRTQDLNPDLYGFQFQMGTRWNPGLSETQIEQYESDIDVSFSPELRILLRNLNGTDLPTLNVYGGSGEPHRTSVGIYSYPRDLMKIREQIQALKDDWEDTADLLAETGLDPPNGQLVPFYGHRYVVCGSDCFDSPVISVYGMDAILYGYSLEEYLQREFL